ncbi:MAG: hypothetical protein V2J12_02690 [Gammaproteobacteria bacterium]|jgi:hypothetical protein|nr:hypothetical protein [Gammaproteobacteria bacterium]
MINASKLGFFVAVFALTVSGIAAAALVPQVNVVELEAAQFKAPAHEADVIELQPCSTCPVETVQVSGDTRYRLNGFESRVVKLPELQRAMRQAGSAADMLIYVAYDAGTLQVNEIVIEASE